MKLNELVRNLNTWTNHEEQSILEGWSEPKMLAVFTEREQAIIENLVRKSLVIKVQGKYGTYVYPNV